MNVSQHPAREISPRTLKNFEQAASYQVMGPGRSVIYLNFWCDSFHMLPKRYREISIPWWELETTVQNRVNITRYYWLKMGIAFVTPTYK